MKSTLDLILEQLGKMTNDEIVEATNYTTELDSCEIQLDGYELYYATKTNADFKLHYTPVNLDEGSVYKTESKLVYNRKVIGEYAIIKPKAA